MGRILQLLNSWIGLLPRITIFNGIEMLIIAVIVYEILVWIKDTKAWLLLRGLIIILVTLIVLSCVSTANRIGAHNISIL